MMTIQKKLGFTPRTPMRLIAILGVTLFAIQLSATQTRAGVYTLTQFHEPGNWSLGLEPEITISDGSGFGFLDHDAKEDVF